MCCPTTDCFVLRQAFCAVSACFLVFKKDYCKKKKRLSLFSSDCYITTYTQGVSRIQNSNSHTPDRMIPAS